MCSRSKNTPGAGGLPQGQTHQHPAARISHRQPTPLPGEQSRSQGRPTPRGPPGPALSHRQGLAVKQMAAQAPPATVPRLALQEGLRRREGWPVLPGLGHRLAMLSLPRPASRGLPASALGSVLAFPAPACHLHDRSASFMRPILQFCKKPISHQRCQASAGLFHAVMLRMYC